MNEQYVKACSEFKNMLVQKNEELEKEKDV